MTKEQKQYTKIIYHMVDTAAKKAIVTPSKIPIYYQKTSLFFRSAEKELKM